MDNLIDSLESQVSQLEKSLKSRSSGTVSDKDTREKIQNICKTWHSKIKPLVVKFLPQSTDLYNLENTLDRLMDHTTRSALIKDVVKDVRAFLRDFRKYVKLNLIKHPYATSEDDSGSLLMDPSHFNNLRKYLSETIRQINITYMQLCPDACAFLIRKLVEFMLYDYYQISNRESDIIYGQGQTKPLKTIVNHFIDQSGARPNEVLKNFLKDSRIFGGTAAHNKRIILIQEDIAKLAATAEIAVRELHTIVYSE